MNGTAMESFQGLFDFAKYFLAALGYLLLFCSIYCKVTPYDELKLVREGKLAPAISFGGATIGFVLPLYSAITNSVGFVDMLIWALVAMVVQILVFSIVRFFSRIWSNISRKINWLPPRCWPRSPLPSAF